MGRQPFLPLSRRSFLQASTMASAALAMRMVTEPMLALAEAPHHPKDAILINSNENPLGPCAAAREAVIAVTPQGGRYLGEATDELTKQFARSVGVADEQVAIYAGSTPALKFTVAAFCSPRASYVTADPGFEGPMFAAQGAGARVVKVPLTKTYAHDVKAMLAAGPDAGVFYICQPNNPTGTLTSAADIEYLVEHKPKNAIVMVDEHIRAGAQRAASRWPFHRLHGARGRALTGAGRDSAGCGRAADRQERPKLADAGSAGAGRLIPRQDKWEQSGGAARHRRHSGRVHGRPGRFPGPGAGRGQPAPVRLRGPAHRRGGRASAQEQLRRLRLGGLPRPGREGGGRRGGSGALHREQPAQTAAIAAYLGVDAGEVEKRWRAWPAPAAAMSPFCARATSAFRPAGGGGGQRRRQGMRLGLLGARRLRRRCACRAPSLWTCMACRPWTWTSAQLATIAWPPVPRVCFRYNR